MNTKELIASTEYDKSLLFDLMVYVVDSNPREIAPRLISTIAKFGKKRFDIKD